MLSRRIPLVEYLVLDDEPYLRAHECVACGARFFDRRNGCAQCGGTTFTDARVSNAGTVKAFTIVSFAAPGVEVPFAAAVIDCDGTPVRANIINTSIDPESLSLGMKVTLAVLPMGADDDGVEAVGFGFEPIA